VAVRRKRRQLLFELCVMTLGAFGLLVSEDDGFKLVAALGAKIFENRQAHSQRTPTSKLGAGLP
jgi:hypothetical protein